MKKLSFLFALLLLLSPKAYAANSSLWCNDLTANGFAVGSTTCPTDGSINVITTTAGYKLNGANAIRWYTNDSVGAGSSMAVGLNALSNSTAGSAAYVATAVGYKAMGNGGTMTTAAINDTAVGNLAMGKITQGAEDTAVGFNSMTAITTGSYNVGVGSRAMASVTTSSQNVAIGVGALTTITSGTGTNMAVGTDALGMTTSGPNVGIGNAAGRYISSGVNNVGIGDSALTGISGTPTVGNQSTGIGSKALTSNQGSGHDNTGIGYNALNTNTTGSTNTAVGSGEVAPTATSDHFVGVAGALRGVAQGGTNPHACVIGAPCIIGLLKGANFNVTTDQAITIDPMTAASNGFMSAATKYMITDIRVANCSASLTTAQGAFYTAASKGGTIIGATNTAYTACTSSTTMQKLTGLTNQDTNTFTAATLQLSLTAPQGGAATADVYIIGIPFN